MRMLKIVVFCSIASICALTAHAVPANSVQYAVTRLSLEFRDRNNKGEQVSVSGTFSASSLEDWETSSTVSITSNGTVLQQFRSAERTKDEPVAINDTGVVVGSRDFYGVREGVGGVILPDLRSRRAFVFAEGVFTDLHPLLEAAFGTPDAPITSSIARDANDAGDVIGEAHAVGRTFGFLYKNGKVIPLDSALNERTMPSRINNFGQVTGVTTFRTGPSGANEIRAFIYSRGKIQNLGALPDLLDVSSGTGLNDAGQIVGNSVDIARPPVAHGFLHEGGMMKDLGTLGGTSADPRDINDAGVVVGAARVAGETTRAFLFTDAQMVDLNTLVDPTSLDGATLATALSIDDDGSIVAQAVRQSPFSDYRVLLTPVRAPEPDAAVFNFESGAQGWVSNGEPIITVTKSTDQRFAGEASLAIKINNAGFASVTVLGPSAQPGQTITFRIYLPADAGIDWIQPFARGRGQWHGNWKSTGTLQLGAWNTLTVNVPLNARVLEALGLELFVPKPYAGVVYLDSVDYGAVGGPQQ